MDDYHEDNPSLLGFNDLRSPSPGARKLRAPTSPLRGEVKLPHRYHAHRDFQALRAGGEDDAVDGRDVRVGADLRIERNLPARKEIMRRRPRSEIGTREGRGPNGFPRRRDRRKKLRFGLDRDAGGDPNGEALVRLVERNPGEFVAEEISS